MKNLVAVFITLLLFSTGYAAKTKEQKMQKISSGFLVSKLTFPVKRKQMFPPCSDRTAWSRVAADTRLANVTSEIRKLADKVQKSPIPELKASEFALYRQTGNRTIYEAQYFAVRRNLEMLVLAECLDGKGKYINRIVDYVWAICSEPCWTIPAHAWDKDDVLPSYKYTRNDLFATQTGLLLAFTLDLMEKELAAFSPHLVDRVRKNIIDRVIVRFESGEPDRWYDGHSNWTPWCCSNILGAAVAALKDDPARLEKVIRKLAEINDHYYRRFSDDGACDEGPGYWAQSPVQFCRFIEQAIGAGVLSADIYNDEKLCAMIQYISNVHLGNGAVFSYSDNSSKITELPSGLLSLLAQRLNDENIAIFAKQAFHNFKSEKTPRKYSSNSHSALIGNLTELFYVPEAPWQNVRDNTKFYSSRGYLFGRSGKLGYGVKGGNNHEGHNHNDVGHFVVSNNGKFIICDLGGATYSRNYFSSKRYENIVCNAFGHNMPLFNGIGEVNGDDKEPQSITFKDADGIVNYTIEAQGTYSEELDLQSVKREFVFDRKTKKFQISDSWKCGKEYKTECVFFTEMEPEKVTEREIRLGKFIFSTDKGKLSCEEYEISDEKVKKRWKKLWKITLSHPAPQKSGNHTITITPYK